MRPMLSSEPRRGEASSWQTGRAASCEPPRVDLTLPLEAWPSPSDALQTPESAGLPTSGSALRRAETRVAPLDIHRFEPRHALVPPKAAAQTGPHGNLFDVG